MLKSNLESNIAVCSYETPTFSGGKDSLFMICLKEPTIDGIVAEITLPGKNGVKKKAVFYNRSK